MNNFIIINNLHIFLHPKQQYVKQKQENINKNCKIQKKTTIATATEKVTATALFLNVRLPAVVQFLCIHNESGHSLPVWGI